MGEKRMFFFLHGNPVPEAPVERVETTVDTKAPQLVPSLRTYPAPESLTHFIYAGEESYAVTGECADRYYAILIYDADIDYRAEPARARYNQARVCDGGAFADNILLGALGLIPGNRYYLIRASQGETGGWYDVK